jgi:3-deoxy-D-manno-octulosonate 8-phosphate phosphatase (KDO 8-P phosphatase)
MPLSLSEIEARARPIQLLLMDCDGVLTDGSLIYTAKANNAAELSKVFHIHDGQGIRLAKQAGLKLGLISGRASRALEMRARELSFDYLYQNAADKLTIYQQLRQKEHLNDEQIAYVGDDLPDLAIMLRVGLGIAVADAAPDVRQRAHHITAKRGGRGAVREAIELILKAQGRWEAAIRGFLPS